ncbi:hypothetical protein N9R28_00960 [Flavobacteriaceae bacterium]|nr:hypothetical protein [Flavobacteriaceae bacterium]
MNKISRLNLPLKVGIPTLILGSGPLLIILLLETLGIIDVSNPIGPGILAFLTFWPSIILIIIGSILTYKKNKRK